MSNKNFKKENLNIDNSTVNNNSNLELRLLYERQKEIEILDKEIEEEKDQDKYLQKLIFRHEFAKMQTKKLLEHITDKYQGYISTMNDASQAVSDCRDMNIELLNSLEKERENKEFYNEFYDNLCYCLLTNPRETFEMMLAQIERSEKLKDNSGGSWQWTYKFHSLARLRMALKLIFG